jgi:hypothetical protein
MHASSWFLVLALHSSHLLPGGAVRSLHTIEPVQTVCAYKDCMHVNKVTFACCLELCGLFVRAVWSHVRVLFGCKGMMDNVDRYYQHIKSL